MRFHIYYEVKDEKETVFLSAGRDEDGIILSAGRDEDGIVTVVQAGNLS